MLLLAAAFIVAFVLLLYMVSPLISPKPLKLPGAHVVVTGGSSGIGKCIAIECYKQGAFITLIARDENKLLQTKKEIEKYSVNDKQVVLCISVDVSKDYELVENVLKQAQEKLGPVDLLVNCAGTSVTGKFEDIEVNSFEVSGHTFTYRSLIKITFTSVIIQVKPYNIYITVAYPPDTDTPGFAEESKTKPLETKLISETSSVCQAEQVARVIVKDAIQGNFNSSVGSDGYMLSILTSGMSPVTSITEGLQQVVCMGIFRIFGLFYLGSFDSIVRRCMMQREKSESADKTE
ncbi:KDSR reductase, partial [Nothocercus julius]|nr:KDSR reductase [Nothocercus julius]